MLHLEGSTERENACLEFRGLQWADGEGLWFHSAVDSCDFFWGPLSSPLAVMLKKGLIKGPPWSCGALSLLTHSHESSHLLWTHTALTGARRGLLLRTVCCVVSHPLPFTETEPSAMLQGICQHGWLRDWEPPLCPRTQLEHYTNVEGNPSKILNAWVWSVHHYGHKVPHCVSLLEVSCVTVTFWETLEATELFLFQTYWHHKCEGKKAHTANEPTANPSALRS